MKLLEILKYEEKTKFSKVMMDIFYIACIPLFLIVYFIASPFFALKAVWKKIVKNHKEYYWFDNEF